LQIHQRSDVWRRVVRRQNPKLLAEIQLRQHLAILGLEDIAVSEAPFGEADRRDAPDVRLGGTLEVHFIVELLHRLLRRVTALESELADASVSCAKIGVAPSKAEANSAATIVLIVPLLIFSRTYRERAGRKIVSEKTLMNWVVATGPPSLSGRLQLMAHLATSATGGISSVRH
jgi:hypothetical protein